MKLGFGDYLRAAFNARPIGMLVPPNWIGLAAFGLLGMTNPGFWAIGLGLELAYLTTLATNPRFQRSVGASKLSDTHQQWQRQIDALMSRLDETDRRRYRAFESRCQSILNLQIQGSAVPTGLEAQADSLGRLRWIYLRLLVTRQIVRQVLGEGAPPREAGNELTGRIGQVERQLEAPDLTADLRRSLSSQLDILRQRLDKRSEAGQKLTFLDAEITRIQEQVELIREQAALSADPEALSRRIDEIATTLAGTSQWIKEQQQIYGAVEDLLLEPPPLTEPPASGEKIAQ
ncbi:MAG: hypothetical protein HYZ58_06980 [Acidobacteria bacterium]|nr:hypothetical protein [Acidobacteriota bacterium]